MKELLSVRWRALWDRRHVPAQISSDAFERLYAHYTDERRGYHGLPHIHSCLETFDEVRYLAVFPDELEAALWWHDVVFDPRATDNELQSEHYASAECALMRTPPLFTRRVGDYIIATTHRDDQVELDQQLICDIDLSSLGAPDWESVCLNSRGIRKEHRHVPESDYIVRRTAILEAFLRRERIFFTHYFRARFEAQARRNIEREILMLPELSHLDE